MVDEKIVDRGNSGAWERGSVGKWEGGREEPELLSSGVFYARSATRVHWRPGRESSLPRTKSRAEFDWMDPRAVTGNAV